jgi:hypothetical protein
MSGSAGFLDRCPPVVLGEGCIAGGGRWISVRNPNGTTSLLNKITGAVVAPANALATCPASTSTSTLTTVAANSVLVLPNTAANPIESWAVRAMGPGVTLDVNGSGAQVMDDNEVIESSAQDDERLTDTVTITTPVGVTARVLVTRRN